MESKNNLKAWLYLAPVLILMAVFTFYPLVSTFVISFLKGYDYTTGTASGITFDNYLYVLGLKKMGTAYYTNVIKYAIPNTLIVTFVTVPISIFLALLIAVGLNSIKPLRKIFQTIFFVPYVTNSIAVGMVFSVIFAGEGGLWNAIFGLGSKHWIDMNASRWDAMFALCIFIIWHALPYKILIFLSGLQNIDKQYYDAAKIDAASKWTVFSKVTVPLLSPQILYVMITSFIGGFKEYSNVVALIGKPSTGSEQVKNMYTVVYYIYDMLESPKMVNLASATAVILFVFIMIFTVIQMKVSNKRVHY
ncbi:MAG: sugar ABC transporter permease [Bacilli bacterium]|nr:sugar ABC transporter permease [Bacilli bacterium]